MTEASKARAKCRQWESWGLHGDDRQKSVAKHGGMPMVVLLSDISCRAGVGGRRGRKRRRREERRAGGTWHIYLPQYEVIETSGKAFDLYESLRREFGGFL